MSRLEAIARIEASLAQLSTEQVETLAELVAAWSSPSPPENAMTRAAICTGLAEADAGEFAPQEAVEAAFARFRA